MPGPTLPAELVIKIVNLAAPSLACSFFGPGSIDQGRIKLLHGLCLSSHAFYEIAAPLLYLDPAATTAWAGRALVRSVHAPPSSLPKNAVRDITLVFDVPGEDQREAETVGLSEVGLGSDELEPVASGGLVLGALFFRQTNSEPSSYTHSGLAE